MLESPAAQHVALFAIGFAFGWFARWISSP
jgi:hypothetical protein